MNVLVHFTSQNLLGTGNSESGNFSTKLVAGTLHFLSRFGLGTRQNAVGFGLSAFLGVFNDGGTALFAVGDDGRRMSTGSSIALIRGGQMNFIVIQHPMKNTTICTNREALMFIVNPVFAAVAGGVRRKPHRPENFCGNVNKK